MKRALLGHLMRLLWSTSTLTPLFLFCTAAICQPSGGPTVITCTQTDPEHCRERVIEGRKLREIEYGGTSVAVGLPENLGNGEFEVYVLVRQDSPGSAKVIPKHFFARFSDPAHTVFPWFDRRSEEEGPPATPADFRASSQPANLPGTRPPIGSPNDTSDWESRRISGQDPNAQARSDEEARQRRSKAQLSAASRSLCECLRPGKVKEGASLAGFVYFRKPSGMSQQVGSDALLDEVDIPVNGVVFRF